MPTYTVRRAPADPAVGKWDDASWKTANIIEVSHFYMERNASNHRPVVRAKMLHSDRGLFVLYDVQDQYVVCVNTGNQAMVCRDSCVEFFLKPKTDKGYFNFEINCGGHMLLYYIEDASKVNGKFAKYREVPDADMDLVKIEHSLPSVVKPERAEPTHWWLQTFVPWELFNKYMGTVTPVAGTTWRGNFFKCADGSSHPHWASWAVNQGELSFHQPQYFGEIRFE